MRSVSEMKYVPQMLQLLREIDDLVCPAAGSSCLCLRICGWARASSAPAFAVPALQQRWVHLGPKSHPMSTARRSRLFCPSVMCVMACQGLETQETSPP